MHRTKYYKSTNEGRKEELRDRLNLNDRPVVIDEERFTEPEGLVSSKTGGPSDDIEDNGLGISIPPDYEEKDDGIPGSGIDVLKQKGIRFTSDTYYDGAGKVISRRKWD